MDIEKLIKLIKGRPGMFVGERLNIRSVNLFVSGFLYSSLVNNSEYIMDIVFRDNIHEWIKHAIEQRKGITFEEKKIAYFMWNRSVKTENRKWIYSLNYANNFSRKKEIRCTWHRI